MSCNQNEKCSFEDCSISKMIIQQWTKSRRQTSEVSSNFEPQRSLHSHGYGNSLLSQHIFQLFQPLVPNEVDEQIETDEQISVENNDSIENDNNNLPKSPRNQQTENSFLVTPNGLVMESHKSARKKNIKIYMVLPENKSPCQVSEIVNHPKSAMNNSDQDVQSSNAEKSNNSRLYSILDFEKPKL